MIGLGVVLLVVAETGRYGRAGALSATFALVNAGAAPAIARLVDRLGQRRVLLPAVPLHLVALVAFVVVASRDAPTWAQVADDRGGRARRAVDRVAGAGPVGLRPRGRSAARHRRTRSSRCWTS